MAASKHASQTTVETVHCGNCGAPLEIPTSANFVTCNHCRSSLAVRRSESVTLTEILARTQERLELTETRVVHLLYQSRVEQERQRWLREREEYLIVEKEGAKTVPTVGTTVMILVTSAIIAVLAVAATGTPFGLVAFVVGGALAWINHTKCEAYQSAYQRHRRRLREIPTPEQMLSTQSPGELLLELEQTPAELLRELD